MTHDRKRRLLVAAHHFMSACFEVVPTLPPTAQTIATRVLPRVHARLREVSETWKAEEAKRMQRVAEEWQAEADRHSAPPARPNLRIVN